MKAIIRTRCLFASIACGELVALAHPVESFAEKLAAYG